MASRQTFAVFASSRQFYVFDPNEPCRTGADDDFWTEEAFERGLAVQAGWIGVATDTNGDVPVSVEVLESEPEAPLDAWDHVVETSLRLSGNRLIIAGCPDLVPVVIIPLGPGWVRVRICAVIPRSNRGDPGGVKYRGDRYLIQLWRSELPGTAVLKRFARGPI